MYIFVDLSIQMVMQADTKYEVVELSQYQI